MPTARDRCRARQLTQDGCAGFLNQHNKRHAATSLLLAACQKKEVGGGGGLGPGKGQEMTSMPSAA